MPAQHRPARGGLRGRPRRGAPLPRPGIGGYDYPRGPYGKTGFPGSTPASLGRIDHDQTAEGRRDRQLSASGAQIRDTGREFQDPYPVMVPKPQPSPANIRLRPGTAPEPGNRFLRRNGSPRLPRARSVARTTGPEHRMDPHIGDVQLGGRKPVRNQVAQRWKAIPGQWRPYRPAANPGKTGARLTGPSQYHPGTIVYGDPEGGPIPAMPFNPDGTPPEVVVSSRYVSLEGGQEGYAMNREMLFAKGGTPPAIPPGADPHIRGARMSGQRYFGNIEDQQRIGIPSDSYGIKRRRGPNHRPVGFQLPEPWTANYYDQPSDQGTSAPDMIHRSASTGGRRRTKSTTRQGASTRAAGAGTSRRSVSGGTGRRGR